ncbi:MAG: ABC transporter ATP-binding protein [Proteobacteria bacterium]|nr:ABC transporter ATP-binding protein [Pseudomonadota bacterium]
MESQSNSPKKNNSFGFLGLKKKVRDYPFSRFLYKYKSPYLKGFVWLLFVDFLNIVQPLLIKMAMDALVPGAIKAVILAAVAYLVVMILQSIGRYWWRVYLIGTANYVASDLRKELYEHLQKIPLMRYQRYRTGDLMSRATNDIESIRMALGPGILVALDAVIMFMMLVPAMLWLSWKLTLLTFAFYPLVPLLTAKIGNKVDFFFEKMQSRLSQMSAYAQETFSGIRLIKALVLENHSDRKFRELSGEFVREGQRLAKYESVFSPSLSFLTQMGTFFILLFGGKDVIAGAISVGTFIAFQRFVVQLSWPMEAIGWSVTMTREAKAAERRIEQILQENPIEDTYPALTSGSLGKELEIRDLHFGFSRENETSFALSLNGLEIPLGKKIGLVGPVGCGKTTLFNLLLRLYEPPPGTLFLKDKDIKTLHLSELRNRVASVEQQVTLFGEKVATNLVMGLKREASTLQMEQALRVAGVWEEVSALREGLQTFIGEKGVTLSGGQRQRLALARALLRQPELLLLDDCFSAVDVECEQQIIDRFFEAYPKLSILFSSHRLSVMPRMDEIWVMESGKVISRGKHSELIRSCHLYRSLWRESERELERERLESGGLQL